MPASLTPPPADDELECGRCGAHFYYELTRCPNCGVNLYEPEDDPAPAQPRPVPAPRRKLGHQLQQFIRGLTRKPYPADELFGAAIDQARRFNDLLARVGGDRPTAERLIAFEQNQAPQGTRLAWIESALLRWERDNRLTKP